MTTLRSYQLDAFERFKGRRAGLMAHRMGLGKTATTIRLLDQWGAGLVVVLAPKAACTVWAPEFRKHSDRNWRVWSGAVYGPSGKLLSNPSVIQRADAAERYLLHARAARRPYAIVVNYEAAWQGAMSALLTRIHPRYLVYDEVHRLKSPSGKAARFAANLQRSADHVLGLSGTPASHSPLDLYGVCRALGVKLTEADTYRAFCQTYARGEYIYVPGGKQQLVYRELKPGGAQALALRMGGLMHRVTAEEAALDLPPETDQRYEIELNLTTRTVYRMLRDELIAEIGDTTLTAANAMVLVGRLAQIANGHSKDAATGKTVVLSAEKEQALAELLEDLDEPVVVFCRYRADLDAVERVAAKLERPYGELSGRRRDALTAEGTLNKSVAVAGVQIQAGGVGISLVRARVAVYYSVSHSLSDYLQSRARLHRPGQEHPVLFAHLVARGTVEEDIYAALEQREEVVDRVIAHLSRRSPAHA